MKSSLSVEQIIFGRYAVKTKQKNPTIYSLKQWVITNQIDVIQLFPFFMAIFTQSFFSFMRAHFRSFPFFSTRHICAPFKYCLIKFSIILKDYYLLFGQTPLMV